MRNILLLTNILLKHNLQKNFSEGKSKKFFVYIGVYTFLVMFVIFISYGVISGFKFWGQEELFINMLFVLYLALVFLRVIFSTMNSLFYSHDNEILLTYPVSTEEILLSKANVLIFFEYFFELIIFLPALFTYGVCCSLTINYYIKSIICLVIFPIIPISIAMLLISCLFKILKFIRNKETMQYFAIFIVFSFMIFIQKFLINFSDDKTNIEVAEKFLIYREHFDQILLKFFNLKILKDFLLLEGRQVLLNVTLLSMLSVIAIITICIFISKFYISVVTSLNTVDNHKRIQKYKYKSHGKFNSYFFKEMKIWIRNPLFLMQCILPPIVFPFIFLIPASYSLKLSEGNTFVLNYIVSVMNSSDGLVGLIVSIFIIVCIFIFNFTSSLAISKDGPSAYFMKYIPIKYAKQCLYKVFIGIVLNMFPIFFLMILEEMFLKGFSHKIMIYTFIITFLMNIYLNFLGIYVDLKNPKINWGQEYAVVKQNFNIMISMAEILLTFIIVSSGIFIIAILTNIDLSVFIISIMLVILCVKRYNGLDKEEMFKKI